ncbi:MAG: hypothetical protein ACKVUS_15790 [Saprospiraceae bacterium]
MKKQLFLYLTLSICLFAACKKDDPDPGPSCTPANRVAGESDNTGYHDNRTYDTKERIVKIERGNSSFTTFVYEPNKVISDITYNSNGTIVTLHQVFALENGFAAQEIWTFSDGSPGRRYEYLRDSAHRPIEVLQFDDDNNLEFRTTYEYDVAGNRVKEFTYKSDGALRDIVLYEYALSIANTLHYGDEFLRPDPKFVATKITHTDQIIGYYDIQDFAYEKDAAGCIIKSTVSRSFPDPSQNYTRVTEYTYR